MNFRFMDLGSRCTLLCLLVFAGCSASSPQYELSTARARSVDPVLRTSSGTTNRLTSLSWMIGSWEWIEKERHGDVPTVLTYLNEIWIYPNAVLTNAPTRMGIEVPAEFHTIDLDEKREILYKSNLVQVFPGIISTGGLSGWEYSYTHGVMGDGTPWSELKYEVNTNGWLRIKFLKRAARPSPPLRPDLLGFDPDPDE